MSRAVSEDFVFTGWSEWDSTAYVLSAPFLAAKVASFVDAGACSIAWDELVDAAGAWSHAERLLVALASDLWRSGGELSVKEMVATLDDANFERVLQAMQIARGWPRCRGGLVDAGEAGGER